MNTTCLIVDDNIELRNMMKNWLENLFPFLKFSTAASAEEAIIMVVNLKPATIIMDIGLPEINGLEATRQIKMIHPESVVIIHSIHDEKFFHEKAACVGADFYVAKQRTQKDLPEAIKSAFSLLIN